MQKEKAAFWNLGLINMVTIVVVTLFLAAPSHQLAAEEPNAMDRSDPTGTFSSEPDMMCGPNCLWQISRAFGKSYSLGAVKHMTGMTIKDGTTIAGLLNGAKTMGLDAIAVKTNMATLAHDPRPAILLLRLAQGNHYVILDKVDGTGVRLLDADRFRSLSKDKLASIWDGHAVLVGQGVPRSPGGVHTRLSMALQISGWLIIFALAALGLWHVWRHLPRWRTSHD